MKRTERRHLKDNELAGLAASAQQRFEERRSQVLTTVAAIVVIGGAAIGWFAWRGHVDSRAHALLAEAVAVDETPVGIASNPANPTTGPRFASMKEKREASLAKYKAVADRYPGTDAGLFALCREASTYLAMGKTAEAIAAYQQAATRDPNGFYGRMARLGLAEAHANAHQYDQAITAYKDLSQRKDDGLPIDGILMELGRTYLDAGKPAEAQQTFDRLVQEYPDSPYNADARRELDNLKKS